MDKIKTGDKVIKVKVALDELMRATVKIEYLKVLGVSDHFAVLNDCMFETLALSKTFEFCHAKPEQVIILESKSDLDIKLFGKFKISIASRMSLKRIENKLNKEFNKWINEKLQSYGQVKDIKIVLISKDNP